MSKITISRTNDVITVAQAGHFKAVFHARSYEKFKDLLDFAFTHEPNVESTEPRKARPQPDTAKAKPGKRAAKDDKKEKKPAPFIIEDGDGKRIGPGEFVKRVIANTPGNIVKFDDLVTNLAQYARARNEKKKIKTAEKSVSFLLRNPKNKLDYDVENGTVSYPKAAA